MTDYHQFLAARGLVAPRPDPAETVPADILPAAPDAAPPVRRIRCDGWTRERQAVFVEAIAQACTVAEAARQAGMSPSSAYALRDRPEGRAFAIGWDAASIAARRALEDECLSRAMHGYWETADFGGRTVRRHKYDNRHARAMLTRLDTLAKSQRDDAVARLAAADLGGFVDALETGDTAPETVLEERAALGLQSRGAYGTSSPLSPLVQESVYEPVRPDFWRQGREWWTDAPTPPGFDGESREAGDGLVAARTCTAQEITWFELDDEEADDPAETYRAWLETEGIEWTGEDDELAGEEAHVVTSADSLPTFVMPGLTRHPASSRDCQANEEDDSEAALSGDEGNVPSGLQGSGLTVEDLMAAASRAAPRDAGSPLR